MNLTQEQKDKIKNHFSTIPTEMVLFRQLIDNRITDADVKKALLAMIKNFEDDITEVKDIIKSIEI